jgi:predicted Zn-dependent protease
VNADDTPTGSIATALAHAQQLLADDPALAAEQAREILRVAPGHPGATGLLGLALAALGDGEGAIAALRAALAREPRLADAWRALADLLHAGGDHSAADAAYGRYVRLAAQHPRLLEAATALCDGRIPVAEARLREHLREAPTDVAAIRMLAEVAARIGRYGDAERLLERCLELAPGFEAARHNYAVVLYRQNRSEQALAEVDRLLAGRPRNPAYRSLKAAVLARVGEYAGAIELYRGVLAELPNQPKVWMSYGHALKTVGRREECEAAYRRTIALAPAFGEAYWSLANLKTFRFTSDEIDAMRAQLARPDVGDDDRLHLHFALGKALEDAGRFEESFAHYADGNRLRRAQVAYDAEENAAHVRRSKALYTREFFASRAGLGCTAPDPIFVVGLPRAGSTLIEQILASHPLVEGTQELPDVIAIARSLATEPSAAETHRYLDRLASLEADRLRALGEEYLARTRIHRKSGAPFFIDKMPQNFAHAGLIHLMLPNAKIVDARRHPLGCCFSVFKQHFARGQHFGYDLAEIGRYYRDYVELMAHFDAVLPGRVHRVFHERMVEDTEGEVRRLLDYCGLPFDERCLRFYETERAVRTASSEQVRRPIYREGVDQWRHYERWLGPLAEALGPLIDAYPAVPAL